MDDSCTIIYGSGPQLVCGVVVVDPSMDLFDRHECGKVGFPFIIELKLFIEMDVVCLQFLHIRDKWMAFEDKIDAEMMIPDNLIIFPTWAEFKSLSCIWFEFDVRISWKLGSKAGSCVCCCGSLVFRIIILFAICVIEISNNGMISDGSDNSLL